MADHDSHSSAPRTAGGRRLRCVVVTPEQTVLDRETDFVALPLYDGELGVAPGHAPMIGRLGAGELRIGREPGAEKVYVEGGFVQVAADVATILTGRARSSAKLDAGTIGETLRSLLAEKAHGEDELGRRERLVAQTRAQLRVALRK